MIYGIKLFFPILLLWALLLPVFKSVFHGLLDEQERRAAMTVTLIFAIVSFLSYRAELYLVACFIAVLVGQRLLGGDIRAKIATFWMAVILFPPLSMPIVGVAGLRYLINLDHLRIGELALLLPVAIQLLFAKREKRQSILWLDLAIVAYPLLCIVMQFHQVSLTTSVRSIVEMCLDIVLPYYTLTRGLRHWDDLNFVLKRLLLACLFGAAVALLEAVLRRNIYAELQWVYGVTWSLTHTLMRGNLLRVEAMTNNPVMLAIQLSFTLGLWWTMSAQGIPRKRLLTVLGLAMAALMVTWSRGPLLGAIAFGLAMITLTRLGPRVFGVALIAAVVAGVAAKMAHLDEPVIALLKDSLSNSESAAQTIDYRSRLLDTSLELIKQSPWTGVPNYAAYMQDLVQGEGIIDMVNTYVGVALNLGIIGLVLYLLPLVLTIFVLLRRLGRPVDSLGRPQVVFLRVCIALMVGTLVTIFTTSIFERVPLLLLLVMAGPGAILAFRPAASSAVTDDAGTRHGRRQEFGLNLKPYADL